MAGFKSHKGLIFAVVVCVIIVGVGFIFINATDNKARDFLFEDSKFTYSTSTTSKSNSKNKADYFTTDMSVKEAYNYIKKNCKGAEESKEIDSNNSFIIRYDDEDVLIYKGEDNKTYVQVANDEYVRENGFTNTYRRSKWNSTSNLILLNLAQSRRNKGGWVSDDSSGGSVRTSSSGSRTSVGGGTSFGK